MSFLVTLWASSLVLVIGMIAYAHWKKESLRAVLQTTPDGLGELVVEELRETGVYLLRGAVRLRPHGERIIVESGVLLKKGHNMLIEKAFGRVATEKGGTSSFFLKRIAEQKGSLGNKDREKL